MRKERLEMQNKIDSLNKRLDEKNKIIVSLQQILNRKQDQVLDLINNHGENNGN